MQISSNYSMDGVPYENRRRQNDIPQFSTERAKQENDNDETYIKLFRNPAYRAAMPERLTAPSAEMLAAIWSRKLFAKNRSNT